MRELVDEVEIESGKSGSVVRLVMYVDKASVGVNRPAAVDAIL